jgi:hypothetical protein
MNPAWLKPALIGVDQDAPFELDGAVGALLAALADGDDHALSYARRAGVIAACTLASTPLDAAVPTLPEPAAADPDALPPGHRWTPALAAVFRDGDLPPGCDTRLKYEACLRLAEAGRVLPPILLPAALDAGRRSVAIRSALLPVLGRRGRWLAAQNPDWSYASANVAGVQADDPRVWAEGAHLERLAWFARLRRRDAAAARELLQAGLAELPAKERAEFVAALAADLEADDALILEPLLKDRSRDVRFTAARLLARLPDTAHAERLRDWAAPLLTPKRGLLGKGWNLDAPECADPAWAAAGIDSKRPQHEALGERAWWLYQLVRQLPLQWWTTQTGMSASELVAWSAKTDWKQALQRGWRERVSADEPDWIEALLALRGSGARAAAGELLAMLPVAQREKHWPSDIDALGKNGLLDAVITACGLGEGLSREYSESLLASMLACFVDDRLRYDYGLRACLLELALLLHPDVLDGCREVPRRDDETPAMDECAQAFAQIIQIRATLRANP